MSVSLLNDMLSVSTVHKVKLMINEYHERINFNSNINALVTFMIMMNKLGEGPFYYPILYDNRSIDHH